METNGRHHSVMDPNTNDPSQQVILADLIDDSGNSIQPEFLNIPSNGSQRQKSFDHENKSYVMPLRILSHSSRVSEFNLIFETVTCYPNR